MKKVTLDDIAKLAGVTKTTVSLVFRNKPGVSNALRKKIWQLGLENNYISSKNIEEDKAPVKIYRIGILFLGGDEPLFWSSKENEHLKVMLNGILSQAMKLQCSINILTASYNNFRKRILPLELDNALLDGLIIRGYCDDEMNKIVQSFHIPVILVDSAIENNLYPQVNIDTHTAMKLVFEHLAEKKSKNIAVVTGNMDFKCSQERLAFTKFYAWDYKMKLPEKNIIIEHGYSLESGERGALKLLKEKCQFDTVICQNDLIAAGVYRVLTNHGLKVPEDVKIVGFDNMAFMTDFPNFTSVNCQGDRLGSTAVLELFNILSQHQELVPVHVQISPKLFIGETT